MPEKHGDEKSELTPYDTGDRLEPHIWVRGRSVISPTGEPRPAEPDDFGRVDFDDCDGATALSILVHPSDRGIEVQIEQFTPEHVRITGVDLMPSLFHPGEDPGIEYRTEQMMRLSAGLHKVAARYDEHIVFTEEGDPFAFDRGNMVFLPYHRDTTCFAITEIYQRAMDWNDPVNYVPIGWQWDEYGLITQPDGQLSDGLVASGFTITSDIDALIARAETWADTKTRSIQAEGGPNLTRLAPVRDTPPPSLGR